MTSRQHDPDPDPDPDSGPSALAPTLAAQDRLAARCLELLRRSGATVATAESLTAGLVAATLADVAGASDVFRGGVVAYASDVKEAVLGVDPAVVAQHGVVSAQCAEAMAVRARALFAADWAVATTGVAGPARQEEKAPGTVYVAVAGPAVVAPATAVPAVALRIEQLALSGSRAQIRRATVTAALGSLEAMASGRWPTVRDR